MKKFEGYIEHNADTIRRLYKAAYDTYETRRVVARFLIGAVLAIGGLMGSLPMIVQAILMMTGCWLIVSRDFPAKCRADRAMENRKKPLPVIVTSFYENYVELKGDGQMKLDYEKFQYLVEEKGYFFLFLGKDSICMIDAATLKPADKEGFKAFVSRKTKKEWKETTSWLNMSLMDLIRMVKR